MNTEQSGQAWVRRFLVKLKEVYLMDQKQHTEPAAHVVRVHRPQISEAERARRMENIRRAAAALVLAAARKGIT